ncbi:MAG: hypothetical protein GF418_16710 [Chitinivibrionales bacterium]|nr:hypothetical protein [Chitinivibrionales bacterium]MBD3397264.1 hypothetical protein [Chitinivibrionales bacterium]
MNRLTYVLVLFAVTAAKAADTVYLDVGASFKDSVDAYPGGTVFVVRAGEHRMQEVAPKSDNVFVGEQGAIMNGSRLLTNWDKSGDVWVHGGQTQEGEQRGRCVDGLPRCDRPEDLYVDDMFVVEVGTLADLRPGTWYFDYEADCVYMADNPDGRKVEVSVTPGAFLSQACNVTIRGITIEKYATPVQDPGAVGRLPGMTDGDSSRISEGWHIEACEVRLNHSVGIDLHTLGGFVVRNCNVHHNGQMGIKIVDSKNSLVESNIIAHNSLREYVGTRIAEEGGTKFVRTTGLTVRSNWAHHNTGSAGLWTDAYNEEYVAEGNLCEYNTGCGIFHEIGGDTETGSATIRCNITRFNGIGNWEWLYKAGIMVSHSCNVEIHHNIVEVGDDNPDNNDGNGITIVYQPRNHNRITQMPRDNYIHDNHITYWGNTGLTGQAEDGCGATNPEEGGCPDSIDAFWDVTNNVFDANHYHLAISDRDPYIAWRGWHGTLEEWQDIGMETNGTVDNLPSHDYAFCECEDLLAAVPNGATLSAGRGSAGQRSGGSPLQPLVRYSRSTRQLHVAASAGMARPSVRFYTVSGRRVRPPSNNRHRGMTFDLASLSGGAYLVMMRTGRHATNTHKIFVTQ